MRIAASPLTEQFGRLLHRRVESVIDAGVQLEGDIRAENDLRIQGTVGGEIKCRGTVTVEEQAICRARIEAQDCDIYGTVAGDVNCYGSVYVASTAVVSASIRAGSLTVKQGARITGSVDSSYSAETVAIQSLAEHKASIESAESRTAEDQE